MTPTATLREQALDLTGLRPVMERGEGRADVRIGLIDGPIALDHPDLADAHIETLGGADADQAHGTFVAGVLCAARGGEAMAICPGCTIVHLPLFAAEGGPVVVEPDVLATALLTCVDAGVDVINLSATTAAPSLAGAPRLEEALTYAARRGVAVVAAAGNQGTVGSSAITRHAGVIAVSACGPDGRPAAFANLGAFAARRGVLAPGVDVTSLDPGGGTVASSGTSAAAPFVTGAIALLLSLLPHISAYDARTALLDARAGRARSITPGLLAADAAYAELERTRPRRWAHV
jgi:subtilisin family serine protease